MSGDIGKSPKLELRLNLPRATREGPSTRAVAHDDDMSPSSISGTTSPPSSCVSSEDEQKQSSSSPEATSMLLVGCPRCLMYVMLCEKDPKCPKCKSTVLVDFQRENISRSKSTKS
ncbi:protein GL2-INTERACTING REPRESSOR 1-like [Typha latifolia]|uniref:protein GL2-INTERACTING REPRESSOR 1-like n=1 Tax=Typha latifolia TaxID=4733 RepID=UPI003C2FEC19